MKTLIVICLWLPVLSHAGFCDWFWGGAKSKEPNKPVESVLSGKQLLQDIETRLQDPKLEESTISEIIMNIRKTYKNSGVTEAKNDKGQTLLHLFVKYVKNPGLFKSLLEPPILMDPNIQDKDGNTALHLAVYGNRIDTIIYLKRHKANPNIQDNEGRTPSHLAMSLPHRNRNLIDTLSADREGGELFEDSFFAAIDDLIFGDSANELIYAHKTDPNIPDNKGNTPVFYAKTIEDLAIWLRLGININHQNKNKETLLYNAVFNNSKQHIDKEYVHVLLRNKADYTIRDKNGQTILERAKEIWGITSEKYKTLIDILSKYYILPDSFMPPPPEKSGAGPGGLPPVIGASYTYGSP